MKIIVFTSNKYLYLLQSYCELFNKHWPNQQVNILGYDYPTNKLPNNFNFISLGKQEDYDPYWSTAMIPYFKNLKEKYFVGLLDDLFIRERVNITRFKKAFDLMKKMDADKFVMHVHTGYKGDIPVAPGIVKWDQDHGYRTTLQASIWKTSYFLKYLKPDITPHEFELNENQGRNDGATVLACADEHLIKDYHIARGGKPDASHFYLLSQLDPEDKRIIEKCIKETNLKLR